jgi:arabinan endo-1,5-alpha-L-arabinosidase
MMRRVLLLAGLLGAAPGAPALEPEPRLLKLSGDISPVHDPALLRQDGDYFLFATNRFAGRLLPMFCSSDLHRWALCGNVLDEVPEWALERGGWSRAGRLE